MAVESFHPRQQGVYWSPGADGPRMKYASLKLSSGRPDLVGQGALSRCDRNAQRHESVVASHRRRLTALGGIYKRAQLVVVGIVRPEERSFVHRFPARMRS